MLASVGGRPHFELIEQRIGGRLVIRPSGEIDLATADTLQAAMTRAIDAAPEELWVDLTDVEFLDSTGLTVLVRAHRALDDGRCRLVVICPGGPVRRAFEVSGLHEHIALFSDRAAAAAARPSAG
jgi:anti-sigma B factor antagonist